MIQSAFDFMSNALLRAISDADFPKGRSAQSIFQHWKVR